jgi:hypothetical protein
MEHDVILFVHIPKTGCTGLTDIFKEEVYGEDKVEIFGDVRAGITRKIKPQAKVVIGHQRFGMHEHLGPGRGYNYATFLRDPVDRFISFLQYKWYWDHMRGVSIDQMLDGDYAAADNKMTRLLIGRDWGEWQPRGPAICERDYRQAIFNLSQFFPVVGITERFQESLERFAVYYGWGKVPPERLFNQAKNPGELPVTQENRERIERHSVWDRKLYEWAKLYYGYEKPPKTMGAQTP